MNLSFGPGSEFWALYSHQLFFSLYNFYVTKDFLVYFVLFVLINVRCVVFCSMSINRVLETISKCEFLKFRKGVEVRAMFSDKTNGHPSSKKFISFFIWLCEILCNLCNVLSVSYHHFLGAKKITHCLSSPNHHSF